MLTSNDKNVSAMTNEELTEKLFSDMGKLIEVCDGFTTAEQSKVVVKALTQLHEAKAISDDEYVTYLKRLCAINGFNVK